MTPPLSSRRRVAVVGMGACSPLGGSYREIARELLAATDAVGDVTLFDVSTCRSRTAGEVQERSLAERGAGKRPTRMVAAALRQADANAPGFEAETAIVGTTSGGMPGGEQYLRALSSSDFANGRPHKRERRALLRDYMPHQPVIQAYASGGTRVPPLRIVSNACASGSNALGHAFLLIHRGLANRVTCGGYDVLTELVFAGFDCLKASTEEKCRPFDAGRTGLALGEGAAMFHFQEWESAVAEGRSIFGEVCGYGASSDNHHLTQPNPDGSGPARAMRRALAVSGWDAASVDYVNAHGTATPMNDATEARAIMDVVPRAAVSSCKSQTGHALGAAGALEAYYCLLALREGFLPASIHFREPDPGVEVDIVANSIRAVSAKRVLSNSIGFGGSNATLALAGGVA